MTLTGTASTKQVKHAIASIHKRTGLKKKCAIEFETRSEPFKFAHSPKRKRLQKRTAMCESRGEEEGWSGKHDEEKRAAGDAAA